jgi:hypothetical protein
MHWSCKPHDASQLQSGAVWWRVPCRPRASQTASDEAIGLLSGLWCAASPGLPLCGAGPTTFGESFSRYSIYITTPARQTLTVILGVFFFAIFPSIAIGIRFRHCPWDLQSPDARLLLPRSARPSKPFIRLTARLLRTEAKSLRDGRGLQPWRVPTCIPSLPSLALSTCNQEDVLDSAHSTKEPLRPALSTRVHMLQ